MEFLIFKKKIVEQRFGKRRQAPVIFQVLASLSPLIIHVYSSVIIIDAP